MGRRRAKTKRRPPTPSDSSSSEEDEEELMPPVGLEESDDEWENGEEDDQEELLLLPVGAEVEVRSDDPGFAGSFYEATVAGHLLSKGSGLGRYTVAYSTLLADDGNEPLREAALAANVRPRPPPPPEQREFAVHEMVEAFHSDGWWAGVVSAVVEPPVIAADRRQPRAYRVTFPASRETCEVGETDLRPHRVFKDGRWVPAAVVDNGISLFSKGNQVEVSGKCFGASWSPATVLKVIGGASYFLVQYMNAGKNGELATEIVESQDIRPARTSSNMDSRYRFSPSSQVEVYLEGSWWPGAIVEVLGSGINKKYVVELKNHNTDMEDMEPVDVLTVEYMQLRARYDWDGTKWVPCVKLLHKNYVHEMNPFHKSYSGPRSTSHKSPVPALYDDSDQISNEPDSRRDKKLKIEDVISQQISPGLSLHNENSEISHKQGNAVLALRSEISLPSLPPMAAFGSLTSSSVAAICHLGESSSQMIGIPSMPKNRQLHASLFEAFRQPRFSSIEGSEKVELNDQGEHSTIGTGTELSRQIEECISSRTAVALGENPETLMKGITAKAIEEDNNVISLSADLDELPNDVTAGCGILPKVNMASCIDSTPQKDLTGSQEGCGIEDLQQAGYAGETSVEQDTGVELGVHESILDTNDRLSESLAIQKHLPFNKTSPIWAQLEALEIFRKAPQRPHFRQFEQYCPELREGMALGLMLSFANLAEEINRLDGLDDKGPLEQKMKGLASLEENGFDVRDLRSHVQTLLATNNSCVEPRKMLEEKIAHKETEDRELGAHVRMLAMDVHRFELHAYLMRNKMRSAVTQKIENAMKISRLKADANDLERSYASNASPR